MTPDLFAGTPAQPLNTARQRDPITSKKAAVDYEVSGRDFDKQTLVDVIRKHPGHTASEYSVILKNQGVDWYKAARMTSKRISDLLAAGAIRAGKVRKCSKTHKTARTYYEI